MSKLSIMEAVKVVPVSESTLRRDLKTGKVSFTTSKNGKKVIDYSELERVYGDLNVNEVSMNGNDSADMLAIKENQIVDLKAQLEKAEMRETALIDERSKLLDLLSAEKDEKRVIQEEKRALMPPVDDKPKSRNWLLRLVGAR